MADVDASPVRATSTGAGDWPAQAADTIVKVVGTVRNRTTGTAITAARAVVYGLLAAVLGTTALILLSVMLVRVVVLAADGLLGLGDADRAGRAVWIAHLLVGLVFVLGGLWLWKKATSAPAE